MNQDKIKNSNSIKNQSFLFRGADGTNGVFNQVWYSACYNNPPRKAPTSAPASFLCFSDRNLPCSNETKILIYSDITKFSWNLNSFSWNIKLGYYYYFLIISHPYFLPQSSGKTTIFAARNIMQGTYHYGNGTPTQRIFVEKPDAGSRRSPLLNTILLSLNIWTYDL